MYPKRFPGYMIWLQEGKSCIPTGFRDTWYDCKKASHVCQEVSGIHDMAEGFRSTRNGRKKASHVCQQFPEVHEMAA